MHKMLELNRYKIIILDGFHFAWLFSITVKTKYLNDTSLILLLVFWCNKQIKSLENGRFWRFNAGNQFPLKKD